MTVTKADIVKPFILDAMTYGFTAQEALKYIEVRSGQTIHEDTYYRYKRDLEGDPVAGQWLADFARIGFVVALRTRIDEMRKLQSDTWKEYLSETGKPYERQNWQRINKLRERLESQNERLSELELATPIIAEIKRLLDRHRPIMLNDVNSDGAVATNDGQVEGNSDVVV